MSDSQSNPSQDVIETATGTLNVVRTAAQRGAADATEAANQAWTATGRIVGRFVYNTCYTISYGVVFPSVLLARSIPVNNEVVRGLIDGAQAARHKVDELYRPALGSSTDVAAPALVPA